MSADPMQSTAAAALDALLPAWADAENAALSAEAASLRRRVTALGGAAASEDARAGAMVEHKRFDAPLLLEHRLADAAASLDGAGGSEPAARGTLPEARSSLPNRQDHQGSSTDLANVVVATCLWHQRAKDALPLSRVSHVSRTSTG